MPPNVLCIVLDTARADAFEPYGAAPGSSPALAQLAGSGRALSRTFSTACWTVPSHASMLTGLLPRAAGLASPQSERRDPAAVMRSHIERLLPERLRRAGYATRAVSTNVWISEANGFANGFDEFVLLDSGRQGKLVADTTRERLSWIREAAAASVDDGAADAERVLGRWIADRDPARPSFWFVNLVECHSPYLPPRPYNDYGLGDRLRAGEDARKYLNLDAIWQACLGGLEVPAAALERMRHLYARSIRLMDDWLSRILERLDAAGILEETLVLVTSDHGENIGENGLMAHAFSLDDRLIRVPLVVAGPGADRFRDRLTSLAELPAKLALATGLEDDPWSDDGLPRGVAVAQFNPPVRADDPRAREGIERWGLDNDAFDRLTSPFEAATDGELKLVRTVKGEQVFDLRADPLESSARDVATLDHSNRSRLDALRAALASPASRARFDESDTAYDHAPVKKPGDDEMHEIEERMRLLGYL